MTIKHKLAFSFVVMILLVAIVGIIMFLSSRLREKYYVRTVETMVVSNMVKEISFFIDQQLRAVDYYILLEDNEERRRFEEYVDIIKGKFDEWYHVVVNEIIKDEITELEDMYTTATRTARRVIATQVRGSRRKAIDMMDSVFLPQEKKLRERLKKLVEEKTQSAREAQIKADQIFMQQTYVSAGVVVLAILLGGVLSVLIFNSIARPLNELKKGAAEIGSGNLDYSLTLEKDDEFGELARSFSEMAGNLKKMQAQIIQLDRMSAMGQLAGGVAHELNNPLTGVLGQAQVLLSRTSTDDPIHGQLLKIERAALRCRKIVRELLDFSRQKEYVFQMTDINELIESTLLLCESDLNACQVRVVKDFMPYREYFAVSPPHIQQVFLNLINNAMQAMGSGGKLTIATRLLASGFTVKDRRGEHHDLVVPGKWLEITFADTGTGVDQKNLSHVFDPFFTTKDVGKGTGLGLTISYGIIQNHKGSISVESTGRGMGATFIIRLPYNREKAGMG